MANFPTFGPSRDENGLIGICINLAKQIDDVTDNVTKAQGVINGYTAQQVAQAWAGGGTPTQEQIDKATLVITFLNAMAFLVTGQFQLIPAGVDIENLVASLRPL